MQASMPTSLIFFRHLKRACVSDGGSLTAFPYPLPPASTTQIDVS